MVVTPTHLYLNYITNSFDEMYMYINHKKIKQDEENYVEVKAKSQEPVKQDTEIDRKNKVFLKGMIERMDNDKYI